MPAGDWLDLLNHYLSENLDAEHREALDRQLTGPLDTYRPAGDPAPAPTRPRPPSWSRITQADIDRMNQHRQPQQ